jgi:hypothetical protein
VVARGEEVPMFDQQTFDQQTFDPETYGDVVDAVCKAGMPAWQRLHAEMKSATRRRGAWDAQHARHLREAEACELWKHYGCISLVDYLEREHGIAPRTALDRMRVSRELEDLLVLESELEEGTFQYCHVRELVRVMTPENEAEWIAAARGKTVGQVQQMVAGHRKGDHPEDPTDPDLRMRRLVVEVSPKTLGMYRQVRASTEAELGHRLEGDDELWQIVLQRSLEPSSGDGASKPAQIWIIKCSECGRGWQDSGGVHAELSAADLACAECDGDQLGSVDAEETTRKRSTISVKLRTQLMASFGNRCAVPGCRSTRHLDVHHIVHREHGGGNQRWNLVVLCSAHHRMHHRGELLIEGRAPDQIRFEWRRDDEVDRAHVSTAYAARR